MNLQSKENGLQQLPIEKVMELLESPYDDFDYFAWPEVFGSTAGPFGGIGGQAISKFTIEAYADSSRNAVVFCRGKVLKVIKDRSFEPMNVKLRR